MQDRLAKAIATLAHAGQWHGSEKFINHPARVASRAFHHVDDNGVALAWLHDVLEQGSLNGFPITGDLLLEAGVDHGILAMVMILTRYRGETYAAYIARVVASGVRAAIFVKWLDIQDHLNHPDTLKPSLVSRYTRARTILAAALDA